jgi:hypothetical protein
MCEAALLRPEVFDADREDMEDDRPRACERLSAAMYDVRFEAIAGMTVACRRAIEVQVVRKSSAYVVCVEKTLIEIQHAAFQCSAIVSQSRVITPKTTRDGAIRVEKFIVDKREADLDLQLDDSVETQHATCARPVTSKPQITVLGLGKPGVCRLGPSAIGGATLELRREFPGLAKYTEVCNLYVHYIQTASGQPGGMLEYLQITQYVFRIGNPPRRPRRLQNLLLWH